MIFNVYSIVIVVPLVYVLVKLVRNLQLSKKLPVIHKISPVDNDFKYEECKPLKIRPFVGKKNFNVNMSIQNLANTPELWLLIENTYKSVIEQKRQVIDNAHQVIFVDSAPRAQLAAKEYYDLVINFMTQRYPQYFVTKGDKVYNNITDEYMPLNLNHQDPKQLLQILARNTEEDVVIFLKDDPDDHDQEYILRSSITAFPAGFDPSINHNKPISFIHGPVPQYEKRLKLSMSRFFTRLESSDLWVRHNWSIQTHKNHFALHENHARKGEQLKPLGFDEIDFENACFLRCERQVLTRLPKLRANIMTVRTYLTPISQIKNEGLGEELCRAIDLLPEEISFYKRKGAWGDAVKRYLRQ